MEPQSLQREEAWMVQSVFKTFTSHLLWPVSVVLLQPQPQLLAYLDSYYSKHDRDGVLTSLTQTF